jgi:hypothetical protein
MEATLQEEVLRGLAVTPVNNDKDFWTLVLEAVLPMHLAVRVCEQALDAYMPWHEPVGIKRWHEVTQTLLEYIALLRCKQGKDKALFLAETRYIGLGKMVQLCPLYHCQQLSGVLDTMSMDITAYMDRKEAVPRSLYELVTSRFIAHLEKQWKRFSCVHTFGHSEVIGEIVPIVPTLPKATPKPPGSRAASPQGTGLALQASPMDIPPSYTQVVIAGGAGDPNPLQLRAIQVSPGKISCRKRFPLKDQPKDLAPVAPTGIPRTWGWPQYTMPYWNKEDRYPCSYPPPPECDNNKCQYYGDWLDFQKVCSYCRSKDHNRSGCQTYKDNKVRGAAIQAEKAAAAAAAAASLAAQKGKAPAGPSTSTNPSPSGQGN